MLHPSVSRYPLISDQIDKTELSVILRELECVLHKNIPGDVVEFGCYNGTTSLFIQRILTEYSPQKTYHVYDSFAGLPAKTAADFSPAGEQFKEGALSVSKSAFINNFRKASLPVPIIHKAWFENLTAHDIPRLLCFAFLDSDFYESIWQSLALVWPHLADGAIVIVDDYQSAALPGARKAVDRWLIAHPAKLHSEASLAVIQT